MTELLPCPFCGGTHLECGGDDKIVYCRCLDCDATGPDHYGNSDWNTRALLPALMTVREAFKEGVSEAMEWAYAEAPLCSPQHDFLAMLDAANNEAQG